MKQFEYSQKRFGLIGLGAMGKGLLYQSRLAGGVSCAAVCDLRLHRCINALDSLHIPYQVAASPNAMNDIIDQGRVAVCEDGEWIGRCDRLDAVVESSSAIGPAAQYAVTAIENKKPVILMNAEVDLMFGPYLACLARKHGVVCTSCDGDQYGVIKHLIDDLQHWGFELVMAGNIKGYLDRYTNPTSIVPEADKRNLDYRMCTSYTDGTKLNIEMAITANAYSLRAPVPGMYGPPAKHVQDVFRCYDFDQLWKDRQPFVDYLLGAEPGGGVFVVGFCENRYQQDMLRYYKMGDGPYYLFYRPYHLCHIEAMQSVRQAAHENTCFLEPEYGMKTNVYAYAKKDLVAGEQLDGIGGYTCYGKIENAASSPEQNGLPIGLSDNVKVIRPLAKDQRITMADVSYDDQRMDHQLYKKALHAVPMNAPRRKEDSSLAFLH